MNTPPEIIVKSDYNKYFEQLVNNWIARKTTEFKHDKIIITAGPYRSSAVSYESKDKILHLDFYSALRTGFGALSRQDVLDIIEIL